MKQVPTEIVKNIVSTKAIAMFGSYTTLLPPSMLVERIIIDVTADPIAVAKPIENNTNFHLFVNR